MCCQAPYMYNRLAPCASSGQRNANHNLKSIIYEIMHHIFNTIFNTEIIPYTFYCMNVYDIMLDAIYAKVTIEFNY